MAANKDRLASSVVLIAGALFIGYYYWRKSVVGGPGEAPTGSSQTQKAGGVGRTWDDLLAFLKKQGFDIASPKEHNVLYQPGGQAQMGTIYRSAEDVNRAMEAARQQGFGATRGEGSDPNVLFTVPIAGR